MKTDRLVLIITSTIALVSVIIYFSIALIQNENGFVFFNIQKNAEFAAVVPHHDLVKDVRRKFMEKLSSQSRPRTIILASVNHFNSGSGGIITSDGNWLVANGEKTIVADTTAINMLIASGLVKNEPAAFTGEHGIRNLLGEIKEFFPDSLIVPLIIKEPANPEEINKLTENLKLNCPDCAFLASVDMSHYQPAHLAEIHDERTLRALVAQDEEQVWQTEIDSNAVLALLISWAKFKNLNNFNLYAHTNSGLLAQNLEAETTTHILGNYSAGESAGTEDEITFAFAGDAMFGRNVGYYFQDNNFLDLFSNLGNRTLWGTDISWLNLEGPVSDKEIRQDPQDKSLVSFNFSKEVIEALKYLKIATVGLANNHTANQGAAGLDKTREVLKKAGVDANGDPNKADSANISRYTQGNITVVLIAVNALYNSKGVEEIIKQEKMNNFVIVLPHWGNEYEPTHSATQEKLARSWIEAGADLIIGMHPHVVQDAQIINDKPVFYSLGNFIFDQMFSKETQEGLILSGSISKEKIKLVLTPVISKKMKPEIMRGADRQKMINKICSSLGDLCEGDIIEI